MNKQVRHEEELFGMQMFRESIILLFQGDAWSTVSHVLVGILSTAYHQKVKQQTVNWNTSAVSYDIFVKMHSKS